MSVSTCPLQTNRRHGKIYTAGQTNSQKPWNMSIFLKIRVFAVMPQKNHFWFSMEPFSEQFLKQHFEEHFKDRKIFFSSIKNLLWNGKIPLMLKVLSGTKDVNKELLCLKVYVTLFYPGLCLCYAHRLVTGVYPIVLFVQNWDGVSDNEVVSDSWISEKWVWMWSVGGGEVHLFQIYFHMLWSHSSLIIYWSIYACGTVGLVKRIS